MFLVIGMGAARDRDTGVTWSRRVSTTQRLPLACHHGSNCFGQPASYSLCL